MSLGSIKPHKVIADVTEYKYVIAGRPKSGKTSLMHGIAKEQFDGDLSKLLLIAFERGYNALDGIYAQDINKWEDFLDVVNQLVRDKDKLSFKMLALDTVDVMSKMATDYVIKTQSRKDNKNYSAINDLAYGKGYELLDREIGDAITKLDKAGYSLFFLTHDKDRELKTKEGLSYNKTTLSLGGRVRDLILNMADFIIFIDIAREIEDDGSQVEKRYIYFRGESDLEAGSRFENITPRIEYDAKDFIETIEEAVLSSYGGDEKEVEKQRKLQAKEKEKIVKENLAKEIVKQEVEELSQEEMVEYIDKTIKSLDGDGKKELASEMQKEVGSARFKQVGVEKLRKMYLIVKDFK